MQRIAMVVLVEVIGLAVELEGGVGDAVGIAAHRGAEEVRHIEIFLRRRIAQNDIGAVAMAIRHIQRLQIGAQRHDAGRDAMRIGQRDGFDFGAVLQCAEHAARGRGRMGRREGKAGDDGRTGQKFC